jgi:hypothetical protein
MTLVHYRHLLISVVTRGFLEDVLNILSAVTGLCYCYYFCFCGGCYCCKQFRIGAEYKFSGGPITLVQSVTLVFVQNCPVRISAGRLADLDSVFSPFLSLRQRQVSG